MRLNLAPTEIKALAVALQKSLTLSKLVDLIDHKIKDPTIKAALERAVGNKSDKPIKLTAANNLVADILGYRSFEGAINTKKTDIYPKEVLNNSEAQLEAINKSNPPENLMGFIERNIAYLTEHADICINDLLRLLAHKDLVCITRDCFLFYIEDVSYPPFESEKKTGLIYVLPYSRSHKGWIEGCINPEYFFIEGDWKKLPCSMPFDEGFGGLLSRLGEFEKSLDSCVTEYGFLIHATRQARERASDYYSESFDFLKRLIVHEHDLKVHDKEVMQMVADVWEFFPGYGDPEYSSLAEMNVNTGIVDMHLSTALYNCDNDLGKDGELFDDTGETYEDDDTPQYIIWPRFSIEQADLECLVSKTFPDEERPFINQWGSFRYAIYLRLIEGRKYRISVPTVINTNGLNPVVFYYDSELDHWDEDHIFSPAMAKVVYEDFMITLEKLQACIGLEGVEQAIQDADRLTANRLSSNPGN